MFLNGVYDEIKQAVRIVVSDAWALNEAKIATNEMHINTASFQFKDFVDPFVERLGSLSLIAHMYAHAEKVFEGTSSEVREVFKNDSMKAEIIFEEFCSFLGRDAGKMREDIEGKMWKGIKEKITAEDFCGTKEDAEALEEWMSRSDKMTLESICDKLYDIDPFGELVPETLNARTCDPKAMAKLLFPAYLYHIGALMRREDVSFLEASVPYQTFDKALLDKASQRQLSNEIKFCIFPEVLTTHPTYRDELYFEAQMAGTNSCGIHSLNHFIGKPIFSSEELADAHILYNCSRGDKKDSLIPGMEKIRDDLNKIKDSLNEDQTQVQSLSELLGGVEIALNAVNSAINAISTIGSREDIFKEDNPLESYAEQIQNINNCFLALDTFPQVMYNCLWNVKNEDTKHNIESYLNSIRTGADDMKKPFLPINGLDSITLMLSFEKQTGIRLHAESGSNKEIKNRAEENAPQEKRDFLKALERNELPNNVDRAIIDGVKGDHFMCVRKLSNGQWILLDSQRDEPIPLPENSLKKLLGDQPYYSILYCKSAEDQQKLEEFIEQVPPSDKRPDE
jgi:hypothetical protein